MANRRRGPISNRRHMARQERERLQARNLTIAASIIVGVVVVLVLYGLIVSTFIEPNQPVASVGTEEITTREFRSRVRYERLLLVSQWNSLADFMVNFGVSDESTASFFVSQMNQIEFNLDPTTVGRSVLNSLIADRLIRAEAEERGITVSEEEIQLRLEETFDYFKGLQAPTPTASPTVPATSTLSPLQMTLTAPTATPTLTITETEALTATAIITDTQGISATETISDTEGISETGTISDTDAISSTDVITTEITSTPVITITPTLAPTPTPKTLEGFQSEFGAYTEQLDRLGITEADFRYIIESQLYREKLIAVLTADVQSTQEQVWARHILVATQAEAEDVIARLESGEEFAALVAELSTDTASVATGGDLGWFGIGQMVQEFEKVAFNQEIGIFSDPTQSQFGWHIIQVIGHEDRALSPQEFEQLKLSVFEEWLSTQRLTSEVELFDIWAERVPTSPSYPAGGVQALLQQLQAPAVP